MPTKLQQLKDELSTANILREDAIKDLNKAHYRFREANAKYHHLTALIEQYEQ